ncbi:MAG: hypothetical protein R3277_13395 [Brumimicrobium sp.]|nr:hypothetical protein [Brumimicrobium sp.]
MSSVNHLYTIVLFIFFPFAHFGQWNIQTGYDFGAMTFKEYNSNVNMNSKWDFVNRFNLITEYSFKNDFLFSVNSGLDIHNILFDQERVVINSNGGTDVYGGRSELNIQTYRLGFSTGYNWHLNKSSSLVFKFNFHQFFINRITIFQMTSTVKNYDVPQDEVTENDPLYFSSELNNRLDYQKIGYRNKWKRDNNNVNVSVEYRRQVFSLYHLTFFAGYSPFDRRIYPVTSEKRNLFLLGLRIVYTFPQKSKKDE